jgi:beta-glucosidase
MTEADRDASETPITPERLNQLVESLSVEEKAQLTAGSGPWHAGGVESIGLPPMQTQDGPNGVRGMGFPVGSTATCTPCGTALAATWDVDLVSEVAARIGLEAKRAGVSYVLGPVINLIRSPLGGRAFECYSEDPILTAGIGVAYVAGMQAMGVAATPKHYVANDAEAHRTTVNCIVDERALREIYMRPFEAVAKAGAWAMMGAYNRLNGVYCCEHMGLVREALRTEWGWDGVLVSDWYATHGTVSEAVAGLDLEMPGPPRYFGPALARAVRDGQVDEKLLNEQARRLLLLAARVGALPGTAGAAEAAPPLDPSAPYRLSDAEAASIVRRAAADSFVLLANDGILPLAPERLRRVAVIGPNAVRPCAQGGGAAHVSAPEPITPGDGLRAALGERVEVVVEQACRIERFLPLLTRLDTRDVDDRPGVTVEFFRGQEPAGEPVERWHMDSSELHLFGSLPGDLPQNDFSIRLTSWLVPAESGPYTVAIRGFGGRRLTVDGVVAVEEWDAPAAADIPTALFEGAEHGRTFELEAGKRVLVQAELRSSTHSPSMLAVGCLPPEPSDRFDRAVAAAAAADVAIVVVGNDESWETEGRDRKSVALPGRQNELVERVAGANPRTIAVVNAGCPVDLPWADEVAAVLYVWLPGQEFGNALADVLLGAVEPGGRLPVTIARREADYPALNTTPDADDRLVYSEGINVGYRGFDSAGIEPLYCFGHGLGYTRFAFESLEVSPDAPALGRPITLTVRLRNTGSRPGKEVVQVYVSDLEASVPRPPRELKCFAVVRLDPGQTADVALTLEGRDFAFWDVGSRGWHAEPGRFEIGVGRSSRDIPLRRTIDLA